MTTTLHQPRPIETAGAGTTRLRGAARGNPTDPNVVLLHGGGQTHHAWDQTAAVLAADGFHAIALDLRGHGGSDWPPDGDYRLEAFADDVRTIATTWPDAAIIGASMGGIGALLAAGEAPHAHIRALVLVDIAPTMEPEGILRIVSFMRGAPDGYATLDDAADAISAYLPDRARPSNLTGLAKNLRQRGDGRWIWHWDPRFLDGDLTPTASTDRHRLHAATERLTIPTLLVRGRMSDLISEQGARDFLALCPHAEYVDVQGAGHMIAGDRNDAFTAATADFLHRLP